MRFSVATWNMDHWKGVLRDRGHTEKAWAYVRALGADIVLLQEAVPPPSAFDGTVPSRERAERWHSGGRARFGTSVVVFGHEALEIEVGALDGDRSRRLQQTHPAAFVAARVKIGQHEVSAVSLYGFLEGPLMDKQTYATTSLQRTLSDLTPLLNARSTMRVVGGDLNVSTQFGANDRAAHRSVFARIASFGLGDCTRATAGDRPTLSACSCSEPEGCVHVQTHRHPKSKIPWQIDYLFASEKQLMPKLVACRAIDDDPLVWELSDHCPLVAAFEL